MKAFVTGSTGFLGTHLVQQLVGDGWEVYAFHRPSSDLTELRRLQGVAYRVGDVRDKASVRNAMPEGIDAVFHAAASVGFLGPQDTRDQYEINVHGTRKVVEVAREKKAGRFIHTSTVLTYDYSDGQRVTEDSPANARTWSPYIHSKYLADLEVEKARQAGLDAVFLHPSAIIGAHDQSTWSKVFREISRGLHIPAAPPGKGTFCHMRRVAEAHVRAFQRGQPGEHYLLGGADATMLELAQKVAALLGRPAPRVVLPSLLFRWLGRVEFRLSAWLGKEPMVTPTLADILCETVLCDSSKATRVLGYQPSSLDTMLQDCYEWMVGANLLPAAEMAATVAKAAT